MKKLKTVGILFLIFITSSSLFAENKYKNLVDGLFREYKDTDKRIAVLRFSYSDGRDSKDGIIISERITTELVKLKIFTVIERKELEKVLEELKLHRTGLIDIDSTKNVGKMLGADLVFLGTLTEISEAQIEINARIVEVESGKIISAYSEQVKKDWISEYEKFLAEETRLIEKNPKDAEAFYERGVTNLDLNEYDKAIANFGIAITINPKYFEAYFTRGFAYSDKGLYDEAIEDFTKAIKLNQILVDTFNGQSILTDDDIDRFDQLGIAYFSRGVSYILINEYDKAIEDFNKALEINPKDAEAYFNRGNAYAEKGYEKGEYDRTIEDFNKALEINPKYAEAYNNRGIVCERLGDYKQAQKDFNMAIKLDPKYADSIKLHFFVIGPGYQRRPKVK